MVLRGWRRRGGIVCFRLMFVVVVMVLSSGVCVVVVKEQRGSKICTGKDFTGSDGWTNDSPFPIVFRHQTIQPFSCRLKQYLQCYIESQLSEKN